MTLSPKRATLLLALVISARATSFMFSKLCLLSMNTVSLLALRFTTAAVILFLIFNRKLLRSVSKHSVISGIIIGTIYYLVLTAEHTGLKTTNASTAAFIENLAIIIVPFIECVIARMLPSKKNLISAALAVIGVGTLTMVGNRFGFTTGEGFLLMAASLYATAICTTSRLVKGGDAFVIGFFQVTTTGVLSWINVAIEGHLTLPQQPSQYLMILMLAVVCTCFGFTLQPVAQSKLSPETAGSFCALGPLVASTLSCLVLKEQVTMYALLGAILILTSLAIQSNLLRIPGKSQQANRFPRISHQHNS
ncbi:MAG: DMT family transporter [Lachnospiraceae bacterium]|nr:DMT family transporter [Lachnospiraceae bacterium]